MLLPLSAKGIKVLTPKYLNDVKKNSTANYSTRTTESVIVKKQHKIPSTANYSTRTTESVIVKKQHKIPQCFILIATTSGNATCETINTVTSQT